MRIDRKCERPPGLTKCTANAMEHPSIYRIVWAGCLGTLLDIATGFAYELLLRSDMLPGDLQNVSPCVANKFPICFPPTQVLATYIVHQVLNLIIRGPAQWSLGLPTNRAFLSFCHSANQQTTSPDRVDRSGRVSKCV